MKRIVPIIVTDDEVDSFSIEFHGPDGHRGVSAYHVPPDDQFARDLRDITTFAVGMADMLDERGPTNPERSAAVRASVARLRAAAGLDNE